MSVSGNGGFGIWIVVQETRSSGKADDEKRKGDWQWQKRNIRNSIKIVV